MFLKLPELDIKAFDLLLADDWKLVLIRKSLLVFLMTYLIGLDLLGLLNMLCGTPIDLPTLLDYTTGL